MTSLAPDVLNFWFGEGAERGKPHKRWFEKDAAFDAEILAKFLGLYEFLLENRQWLDNSRECLARIIVLDQFPRNMFRGSVQAFASDPLALEAARHAALQKFDREMLPVERLFVYLPYEHSELLEHQMKCCELMQQLTAFPETKDIYAYAVRHRDIIQRFGRFPHRNAIMGRQSTPEEIEFLKQPGSGF